MAVNLCEVCGSRGKDNVLLSFAVMPKKVAVRAKVINPEVPTLCARCRVEIADWYRIKVRKAKYDSKGIHFIPLDVEELAREYQSAYFSFYAHKRLERMQKITVSSSIAKFWDCPASSLPPPDPILPVTTT